MDNDPRRSPLGETSSHRRRQTQRGVKTPLTILARQGQQQHCEDVLATTRALYGTYLKNLQSPTRPVVDSHTWRQYEIAAAQPVSINKPYFGSDALIGTQVRDAQGEALGDVVDLKIIPNSAVIVYVLIARGGFFGFDETYVPVPWRPLKMTPNGKLLVLEISRSALDDAPQLTEDEFMDASQFERLRGKVDIFWKANIANPK